MDQPTYLNVMLRCTKTNHFETQKIHFNCPPITILDIKEQIQKQFSLPVCVQVLLFDGYTLRDEDKLSLLKIRDGDTICVKYLAKANCSDLNDIVAWLKQLSNALNPESPDYYQVIFYGIQHQSIENLFQYLTPWYDPTGVSYSNKLHFVHIGGFKFLMEVYAAILKRPWQEMSRSMKYVEKSIPSILWSLVETIPFRQLVFQHNGVQMCSQSLLRVKMEEGKWIDKFKLLDVQSQDDLAETMFASAGILCNLADLPECRVPIASNEDTLNQLTCLSLEPTLTPSFNRTVAVFFYTLAYTPEAHVHIAKSDHIRRLLKSCERLRSANEPEALLVEHFTYVYLAQVCLISPSCIESSWHTVIHDKLDVYLHTVSYKKIREEEIQESYEWLTVEPFVNLLYLPAVPQTEGLIGRVQLLSLQLVLFVLQNMLGRESQRELLLKEGLLDFITCCPQYIPPSLRPQAEELVQMVVSSPDIPEGPPKLLNIVKARLAKMHFGLEQVLSLSVSEIGTNFA